MLTDSNSMHSFNEVVCTKIDKERLVYYFEQLNKRYAEAYVSEIINLNNYQIERNQLKSIQILRKRFEKSFIFLVCLN